MRHAALMFGAGTLTLASTGRDPLAGRDCGVCCKGVGLSGSAAYA